MSLYNEWVHPNSKKGDKGEFSRQIYLSFYSEIILRKVEDLAWFIIVEHNLNNMHYADKSVSMGD